MEEGRRGVLMIVKCTRDGGKVKEDAGDGERALEMEKGPEVDDDDS